jgi:SagB-type dehydrogenase family enzyme
LKKLSTLPKIFIKEQLACRQRKTDKGKFMDVIGDQFQEETKYSRDRMSGRTLDWPKQPKLYKTYPDKPKHKLPDASALLSLPLGEVLKNRKSVRTFSDKPICLEKLSCLLWACAGISRKERGYEFRTAPSAGALYPIETYIVVNRAEGIAPGVYHYAVCGHELELLKEGHCGEQTARAALGQTQCMEAPVVFIWTAVFQRTKWKYGQRAYRYIYLDAGHIAENLALAAVSLGLGSCQIGALFDEEINQIIGVDGKEESVLYMTVAGYGVD